MPKLEQDIGLPNLNRVKLGATAAYCVGGSDRHLSITIHQQRKPYERQSRQRCATPEATDGATIGYLAFFSFSVSSFSQLLRILTAPVGMIPKKVHARRTRSSSVGSGSNATPILELGLTDILARGIWDYFGLHY